MSTYFPIKYNNNVNGSELIEMDSDDLERLSYQLRYAYGQQLNSAGHGSLAVGAGETIGTLIDSKAQIATNVKTRNNSGGADYPAYPTDLDYSLEQTYTFGQLDTDTSTFATGAALDSDGLLYYNVNVSGTELISITDSDHIKPILTHCLNDMLNGDKVGTYEVSTASPSDGGTWVNKGTWYQDTTYSAGTTTYNYYLKTDATPRGEIVNPIGIKTSSEATIQERLIAYDAPLIQNVLLPALNRRVKQGECLNYLVDSSASAGLDRGAFSDTRQDDPAQGTQNQNFGANDPEGEAASNQYWRTLTPAGSAITHETKRLVLKNTNLS